MKQEGGSKREKKKEKIRLKISPQEIVLHLAEQTTSTTNGNLLKKKKNKKKKKKKKTKKRKKKKSKNKKKKKKKQYGGGKRRLGISKERTSWETSHERVDI